MNGTSLTAAIEHFPIAGAFTISRGTKTQAEVVHVTLTRDGLSGHGECVPYQRYGETVEETLATVLELSERIGAGMDRLELQSALPSGAARNALDCAFWDLEAKLQGKSVAELAGLTPPEEAVTAYTISLDTPEAMAEAARTASAYPLLKLKLGGEGDIGRLAAVRQVAPDVRLVVDANEAWVDTDIASHLEICREFGIELVEQPLPARTDLGLAGLPRAVPVCADESCHDRTGLADLAGRYDAVNIKLDKAGGLTEAIAMAQSARQQGFRIMVGCMVGTSLAMAPALLLSEFADWVDLDGPLLLREDRPGGLRYEQGRVSPNGAMLWGVPWSFGL